MPKRSVTFSVLQIATQIFLDNNFTLLKTFIGANDTARQRRFVEYLDRLIGVKLGYEAVGALSEEEQRILDDGKRLEKNVPKFIKEFGVPERIAPNAMTARCRECLLYHHHRWVKNETTLLAFEETALVGNWDKMCVIKYIIYNARPIFSIEILVKILKVFLFVNYAYLIFLNGMEQIRYMLFCENLVFL